MENLVEIYIALLISGGVAVILGLVYLRSPSITPENKVGILQKLKYHHKGGK